MNIYVPSPAVAIVGRHNSGKTTLVEKLIAQIVSRVLMLARSSITAIRISRSITRERTLTDIALLVRARPLSHLLRRSRACERSSKSLNAPIL